MTGAIEVLLLVLLCCVMVPIVIIAVAIVIAAVTVTCGLVADNWRTRRQRRQLEASARAAVADQQTTGPYIVDDAGNATLVTPWMHGTSPHGTRPSDWIDPALPADAVVYEHDMPRPKGCDTCGATRTHLRLGPDHRTWMCPTCMDRELDRHDAPRAEVEDRDRKVTIVENGATYRSTWQRELDIAAQAWDERGLRSNSPDLRYDGPIMRALRIVGVRAAKARWAQQQAERKGNGQPTDTE